jgi:hypothetical protein
MLTKFRSVNTEMKLKETGCKSGDWIHLSQDRVQKQDLVNMMTQVAAPLTS